MSRRDISRNISQNLEKASISYKTMTIIKKRKKKTFNISKEWKRLIRTYETDRGYFKTQYFERGRIY